MRFCSVSLLEAMWWFGIEGVTVLCVNVCEGKLVAMRCMFLKLNDEEGEDSVAER